MSLIREIAEEIADTTSVEYGECVVGTTDAARAVVALLINKGLLDPLAAKTNG